MTNEQRQIASKIGMAIAVCVAACVERQLPEDEIHAIVQAAIDAPRLGERFQREGLGEG